MMPAARGEPLDLRQLAGPTRRIQSRAMKVSKKNFLDGFVFMGLMVNAVVVLLILYFYVF